MGGVFIPLAGILIAARAKKTWDEKSCREKAWFNKEKCPVNQVIIASWKRAHGALVMMVLNTWF